MTDLAELADEVFETDILVIGGGSGGCPAAIRARELGAEVLVVEKGGILRSGALGATPNSLHVVFREEQSFEEALEWEKRAIDGLVHTRAFRIFYEDSELRMHDLESWGCTMVKARDDDARYVRPVLGLPHVYFTDPVYHGPKPAMVRRAKASGAKLLEWTMVTSLLTEAGRVVGATGFNIRTGAFYVFKSRATILCTGTGTRLYRPASGNSYINWHPPFCTGDGHAMAFRAGAELTNMEFPCFTMSVQGLASYLALEMLYMPYCDAPLLNRLGERFIQRYDPELLEMTSRDTFCRAIVDEYEAGRGPCYIDTSKMSPEALAEWKRWSNRGPAKLLTQYLAAQGLEIGRDLIEVGLSEPILYNGGVTGCWIGEHAETNVPGLYAVGDAASGTAIRGINGAMCTGWRAAEHAAQSLAETPAPRVDPEAVARERERVMRPLQRNGSRGIRPKALEARLNDIMSDHVAYKRDEAGLRRALRLIEELRPQIPELTAENPHELMKAIEVQNLIDCGQMIAEAALFRQESRNVPFHYRTDYPHKDDENWLAFVILRRDGDRTAIEKRPVQ